MKVLITGGSGFIGTNLVQHFLRVGYEVLSVDVSPPRIKEHKNLFKNVSILDLEKLCVVILEYKPTHIVHLAARADLDEKKDIRGYEVNIKGVENLIAAMRKAKCTQRCIFASTKLVIPNGETPKNELDYRPDSLYGQSKVIGEKIVRAEAETDFEWCIIRPSSIWGPWSDASYNPYGRFFKTVAGGYYFHPGNLDPPRSYGYVGNAAYQIQKLLEAPVEKIHKKTFYLADYENYHIRQWANTISMKSRGRRVKTVPMFLVRLAAVTGDLLKLLGVKNPPITSFRLKNMMANTATLPLDAIKELTGQLPFSIDEGVDETVKWLKRYGR
ncbi:MAG TPA: NAD(P)-dependent oxidoreductase [bacterium]|nr:NAD(P)-dependent oxidoreductase [bacterium]